MSELDVSASTPTGGDTSAPAAAPAIPSAPAISPTTNQSQAPATGVPEDRSNWVPPYRIRESREAALREAQNAYAQQVQAVREEAERYKQQLHSLVGATPPQNPEVEQVRQQFAALYPGLAKMESQSQQLEALLERAGDLESQNEHYWRSYGRQTVDRLFTHAQESIGGPLTDEGKRLLHSSFVGWVQSSPELSERYSNDPTIVEDFWKAFSSGFIDPVRRGATAQIPGRAGIPLPQDTPSGGLRTATPQAQPKDLDERAQMGWALYNNPNTQR